MLRTIRLTAAIVCFTLITLLFLDFTGTLHTWFGWLGENSVPTGSISLEHRCRAIPYCAHITIRAYLLFGHLPVRGISGCCFMVLRQTEKESLPLFSGFKMAEIWCIGCIHPCLGCRAEYFCRSTGTLQCIRPDGFQSAGPGMAMGK